MLVAPNQDWSASDRLCGPATRDPHRVEAFLVELQRSCALGRVLEIGCGGGDLVRALVNAGVDATGVDGDAVAIARAERLLPGRCRVLAGRTLEFPDESFETVVALGVPVVAANGTPWWIAEVARVASRHVCLCVARGGLGGDEDRSAEPIRAEWESWFFLAGFRRHPAVVRVVGYEGLERDDEEVVVLLEKIGREALAAYPLARLAAERDLHMDMLRESGRRSDAHLQRYEFAAGFVRPNAAVLDIACGLGYGAAIAGSTGRARSIRGIDNSAYAVEYARTMYGDVAPEVTFVTGDAHELAGVADHSIDLVLSFETLEHLADPGRFVAQVRRVLTPGGRFIGSIPNEWVDETGRDPNPHHLHVFDAARLVALFSGPMWVESLWAQTAGGGIKNLGSAVRAWWQVDPARTQGVSAEWWIVVVVKDPSSGEGIPYVETLHHVAPGAHRPVAVSFGDAYANPWLRHAMVTMGVRVGDPALLRRLCESVARTSPPGSVDAGAALCVRGYQLLEERGLEAAAVRGWLEAVELWIAAVGATSHHHRWRVSLEFLAGKLLLAIGARAEALVWFDRCAGADACTFSPLLATKTVQAGFLAGMMRAHTGDLEGARTAWAAALESAGRAVRSEWREVVGTPESPLTFGARELAGVMDQAARCAAGLQALDTWRSAPGRLAEILASESRADRHRFDAVLQRRAWEAAARQYRTELDHARAALAEARADLLMARISAWAEGRFPSGVRELVVWGAGSGGRRLHALFKHHGVKVAAFIDGDPAKAGSRVDGVPIETPRALDETRWRATFVVIASTYAAEIAARLEATGRVADRDFSAVDFGAVAVLERREGLA